MSFWVAPSDIKWDQESLNDFNRQMLRYSAGMGKTLEETMIQWAGRLAEEMMRESPPFVDKSASNTKDAQKRGERAVKEALLKSVTPVSVLMKDDFKNKTLEKIVKRKKYADWEDTTQHMPKLKHWKAKPFSEDLHMENRPKGRFDYMKQKKVVTFDESKWKRYLKKLQARVGYLKAGWARAVHELGRNVPGWIRRHMGYAKGTFSQDLNGDKKTIEFSNATPTVVRFSSRYNYAMDWISKKMIKQMEIALAAEARKLKGK